jgi:RNA polymerase sigma-B factor
VIEPQMVEELLRRHADGDPHAQAELVRRFLPFARELALRYRSTGEPMDDLVQVASIGLLNAIDRFDAKRGTPFTSFAAPTILGELRRHFRDHCWAVRMPRGLKERGAALAQAESSLCSSLGRSPTVRETAGQLGWDTEEVLEAREAAASYRTVSLDAPTEHDHESPIPLRDSLGADDPAYELVEGRAWLATLWRQLPAAERTAIHLRFFHGLTQEEIGQRIGYSQMHVSRLLRRALGRMRAAAATTREAA